MSHAQPPSDRDRLLELLAEKATLGISPAEQAEVEQLLFRYPDVDAEQFDRLAASIDLSLGPAIHEPLPLELRAKISNKAVIAVQLGATETGSLSGRPVQLAPSTTGSVASWLGWAVAAASIVVAVLLWQTGHRAESPGNLEVAFKELQTQPGTIDTPIVPLGDEQSAKGEVVWNDAEQRGFMRLHGLPVNDPLVKQYQLWIFSKNQSPDYPIDGGVFDVSRSGDVIIPIRAAIQVDSPTMYAITVEKPGGVVVSDRKEIVLLGKVAG